MAVKNLLCENAAFNVFWKLMFEDDDIALTFKFHKKVQKLYCRVARTSLFHECNMHLLLVKIQHCNLHSFERLWEGHQAQAHAETARQSGAFRSHAYKHIYKECLVVKNTHTVIYELAVIAVLRRSWVSWVSYGAFIFLSAWKWQHSNYSAKVNRPQIWLLNLSGCLFSNHQ